MTRMQAFPMTLAAATLGAWWSVTLALRNTGADSVLAWNVAYGTLIVFGSAFLAVAAIVHFQPPGMRHWPRAFWFAATIVLAIAAATLGIQALPYVALGYLSWWIATLIRARRPKIAGETR